MSNELDDRKVADIIIAKDLNMANNNVQTQALEVRVLVTFFEAFPNYEQAYSHQEALQSHSHAWGVEELLVHCTAGY